MIKKQSVTGGVILNKLLYDREIDDELMIQFILMYALGKADEPLAYTDLLNVVQGNCEINFTDLQLALDNLIQTGHAAKRQISEMLTVYSLTRKGKYVIDFFYSHIPLIIREPIDRSIKDMYLEKRRREAVRASVTPINMNEYTAECELYDDDKMLIMSLSLYAGTREHAEAIAEFYKKNSAEVYGKIIDIFADTDENGGETEDE